MDRRRLLFLSIAVMAAAFPARVRAAGEPAVLRDPATRVEPAFARERPAEAALAVLRGLRGTETASGRSLSSPAIVELGTAGGGITRVALREEILGVPVFQGEHSVFFHPDGTVHAIVMGRVPDPGDPGVFLLSREGAIAQAAAAVNGDRNTVPPETTAWQVVDPDGPEAAWRVEISEREDPAERWCVLVSATSGAILRRIGLTDGAATRGRVWPRGALHPPILADFTDGEVLLDPASPAGWTPAGQTEGNNGYAEEDRAGDTTTAPGLRASASGDPLAFDFPFTGVPRDDLDAALTNVFWAINEAHDRFYRLGFDEASGNCQNENFGRGGRGGDRVRVFVQYRAGAGADQVRNSNTAFVSGDGAGITLTFGLWDRSGQVRDGALDTGLVFHELAHTVVSRLAGNDPTCDDGTQPAALAEGWADYFAASFTGETLIGGFVSGNSVTGLRTTRVGDNRYSYANLCNVLGAYCSATENGEIWTGALWDLRAALIATYGPDDGPRLADLLIVEGMRYTPCRPTFPQARDGLLLADAALTGGRDHCLIWTAMSLRGIGLSAATAGPDDTLPVPGFNRPAECSGGASVQWNRARYGDDADARVRLWDAAAGAAARSLQVTSSTGDSETFPVPGSGLARTAIVPLRPGAAAPGDGFVQVAEGATVTARCADCPAGPSATAAVSRALDVRVNSHRVTGGSCDADAIGDFPFPQLSGLLDAGEWATLTVTLGNAEPFPLEDVRVRVTCDNPDVQVLPAGEVPVGAVPGRAAAPWPIPIPLRALVAPPGAVAFGDTATLTFQVTARGLAGMASLAVPLAADYRDDRGLVSWGAPETFEPSSPTRALWTHAPAAGQPADLWQIQPCGDGGGNAMAYAGAGCTEYADTPSAATLVSPPLVDMSGGVVAVHPLTLAWRNDVDLGVDPRSLYCESEMVLLYMTDNPARPAYGNPIGDRLNATQYWANWPLFFDVRNTSGWADGAPRVALTTGSFGTMSPGNVRLYWVFFTDVYNPVNNGGCRLTDPDAVGGGYRLDNVAFTYDQVRLVPQATAACLRTCGVRADLRISPPGGTRCAGDPVTLSAALSEAAGCPGGILEYQFTGPGITTPYSTDPVAVVSAAPGATWTVRARCAADTGCTESASVADPTLDDSTAGRVVPASLRVRREEGDVILSWEGTRAPVAYAVFRATPDPSDPAARGRALSDLALSPPADPLRRGSPDALAYTDAGAAADGARLHAYRVTARMPCAGTALPY